MGASNSRIGIHLGDLVEEADGDLMGDGVNIAARLHKVKMLCVICLSEDAHRHVKVTTQPCGLQDFWLDVLGKKIG